MNSFFFFRNKKNNRILNGSVDDHLASQVTAIAVLSMPDPGLAFQNWTCVPNSSDMNGRFKYWGKK